MKRVATAVTVGLITACMVLAAAGGAHALSSKGDDPITGRWAGVLEIPNMEDIPIVLTVSRDDNGALQGSFMSPAQSSDSFPVDDLSFAEGVLTFDLAIAGGFYRGTMTAGDTIEGTWSQGGGSMPLTFSRAVGAISEEDIPENPQTGVAWDNPAIGTWKGSLSSGGAQSGIVIDVFNNADGELCAFAGFPDQSREFTAARAVMLDGRDIIVVIAPGRGEFTGTVARNGSSIEGKWIQAGRAVPLTLRRSDGPSAAEPYQAPDRQPAEGSWSGDIQFAGRPGMPSRSITVVFDVFRDADGRYAALFNAGGQGYSLVEEVAVGNGRVNMTLDENGSSFTGELTDRNGTLEGTIVQRGNEMPVRLTKE